MVLILQRSRFLSDLFCDITPDRSLYYILKETADFWRQVVKIVSQYFVIHFALSLVWKLSSRPQHIGGNG